MDRICSDGDNYSNQDDHDGGTDYQGYPGYRINNSIAVLIVWFFVVMLVVWLAIYALSPGILMRKDSLEIDSGKALLASVAIAFIVVIILWFIFMIL